MLKTPYLTESVPVSQLRDDERAEMFQLYERHYAEADPDRFAKDLLEKDSVVLVRGSGIFGFTTIVVRELQLGSSTISYLFSGDTVLDTELWGNSVLLRGFFRAAGAAKAKIGDRRLFWFTIVSGHRTFRMLPNFFRSYAPTAIDPCDELMQIRSQIALARYGANFDPATGLIDFGRSLGHLRPELATVESTARRNPNAAYFLRANPHHARGVELACVAELHVDNLKRYGAEEFARGFGHA